MLCCRARGDVCWCAVRRHRERSRLGAMGRLCLTTRPRAAWQASRGPSLQTGPAVALRPAAAPLALRAALRVAALRAAARPPRPRS